MSRLSTQNMLPMGTDPILRRSLDDTFTRIIEQLNVGTVIDNEAITGATTIGKTVTLVDPSATGSVIVTLVPAIEWEDRVMYIRHVAKSGAVKVVAQSGELIDGSATYGISPSRSLALISDGSGWHTAASGTRTGPLTALDYGAIGDGVADDTAAINAALADLSGTGTYLRMTAGTYNVSSVINIPTKTGMIGDRGAKIFALKSGFNNTTNPTSVYTSTTIVIDMSGGLTSPFTTTEDQKLIGMVIEFESFEGTVCNAVVARNCSNIEIDRNEIKNFNLSTGVLVASIINGGRITNNYIHDFANNTVYGTNPDTGLPYTSGDVNIYGIEVDDDRVDGVVSGHLRIQGNYIESLAHGATAIATYSDQADGIGIHKGNYHKIADNTVIDVNEGIDTFGDYATIIGNILKDNGGFGIKLIHGASFNTVTGNQIINPGLGGLSVTGGVDTTDNVEYNVFTGNIIINVDPTNANAAFTTGCINIDWQTFGTASNNTFINNILDAGTNGKYNIVVQTPASNINNSFVANTIVGSGTVTEYSLDHLTSELKPSIPTMVSVYRSTSQTITSGNIIKVEFDTEIVDRRAEYDKTTNHRWTCTVPGFYQVTGGVRIAAFTTPDIFVYKNDSLERTVTASTNGDDSVLISYIVECAVGDYVDIRVRHSAGADRTVTGGSDWSYMTIGQI